MHLARKHDLPLGIEAPAYTLEAAAEIDPSWLAELRDLTVSGPCEYIGSGYAQIIAPLVPAKVNEANLRIGNARYEGLLGFRPEIALINEQAYSAGLIELYRNAGYRAIVMEWDNPASSHPEWDRSWRYLPQVALAQHGEEMPLLWNKSLAFQKFQRYAHGEMEFGEYFHYLESHISSDDTRAFNLYGNDIEIFDFRPGRFHTEALLEDGVEWQRIEALLEALHTDDRFEFVRPSQVLDLMDAPGAGNRLHLESPDQPVPVKKQGKYNLTRWAVTPRDDLGVNTECWRIYEHLLDNPGTSEEQWKELCYLWSSDFRTHITEKRWRTYRERLDKFAAETRAVPPAGQPRVLSSSSPARETPASESPCTVERQGKLLVVANDYVTLHLNTRRGLAIDALTFKDLGPDPVVGTLEHGYYDDISLGADFYTGHFVLEPPGVPKITDLEQVAPEVDSRPDSTQVSATIQTALGPFRKTITVSHLGASVEITCEFDWAEVALGSFRIGHVTFIPSAFERDTLYYATHNGAAQMDGYALAGTNVDLGRPVSPLVSASGGLGVTEGVVEVGDAKRGLRVAVDKGQAALIALVAYREVGDTYFCRLSFSALEMDETARLAQRVRPPAVVRVSLAPR